MKADAVYEDSAQGADHCGLCEHFAAPHRCRLVVGDIASTGWCRLFAAETARLDDAA
jgi:hypothetical protein